MKAKKVGGKFAGATKGCVPNVAVWWMAFSEAIYSDVSEKLWKGVSSKILHFDSQQGEKVRDANKFISYLLVTICDSANVLKYLEQRKNTFSITFDFLFIFSLTQVI